MPVSIFMSAQTVTLSLKQKMVTAVYSVPMEIQLARQFRIPFRLLTMIDLKPGKYSESHFFHRIKLDPVH